MATLDQLRKEQRDKDLQVAVLLGLDPNYIVRDSMWYAHTREPRYIEYDVWVNGTIEEGWTVTVTKEQADQIAAILDPPPTRMSWHDYFLGLAKAASARADCTRRKVGAVLVDENNRVLSVGYNGAPAGQPGCLSDGACPRGQLSYNEQPEHGSYNNCIAVHAEANALLYAGRSTRGCTMYITDPPCPDCAKLLAAAGVNRVVWPGKEETT